MIDPLKATPMFELCNDYSNKSGCWGPALAMLFGTAIARRARRMIEIGVWKGGSTTALLWAARMNDGRLISIDVNDCKASIPPELQDRWEFIQGDSRTVLPSLPFVGLDNHFDLALIDGEHRYEFVKPELFELDRRMAQGGCILLDDLWDDSPGVIQAFEEFNPSRRITKKTFCYGTEQSYAGVRRTAGIIYYD